MSSLAETASQSETQKRGQLRKELRSILRSIEDKKEDLSVPGNEAIQEYFEKWKTYGKQVRHTQEGLLENQALLMFFKLVNRQTQALDTSYVSLDKASFAEQLTQLADTNTDDGPEHAPKRPKMDWAVVGNVAAQVAAPTPLISMMYGPLSMDLSKRVVTRAAKRKQFDKSQAVVVASNPTNIEGEKDLTASRVQEVTECLTKALQEAQERHPDHPPRIGYFEFVIDPWDFGQTVENIFHLSFLIKDGSARVFLDEDGLPCIGYPPSGDGSGASGEDGGDGWIAAGETETGDRVQHVMEISHEEWKSVVETFAIKEPILPHRETEEE